MNEARNGIACGIGFALSIMVLTAFGLFTFHKSPPGAPPLIVDLGIFIATLGAVLSAAAHFMAISRWRLRIGWGASATVGALTPFFVGAILAATSWATGTLNVIVAIAAIAGVPIVGAIAAGRMSKREVR
jgi:hypothetical protein